MGAPPNPFSIQRLVVETPTAVAMLCNPPSSAMRTQAGSCTPANGSGSVAVVSVAGEVVAGVLSGPVDLGGWLDVDSGSVLGGGAVLLSSNDAIGGLVVAGQSVSGGSGLVAAVERGSTAVLLVAVVAHPAAIEVMATVAAAFRNRLGAPAFVRA